MRTRLRRLLPDRTSRVEAALYLLGTGAATVGSIATLVLVPSTLSPGEKTTSVIGVVVGLLVVAAALARRPRPDRLPALALGGLGLVATATVVTAVVDPRSATGSYLAAFVLLAVAVRRFPPRVAVLAGLLAFVTFAASAVAQVVAIGAVPDVSRGGVPEPTASDAAGWVVAVLVGLLLRSGDGTRRVEALARVRASERLLVARELHDLVARHVTGMVVRTQALTVVAPDLPPSARTALDDIEAAGNDALAAMRRMVGVLREVDGDGVGALDELPSAAVDVASAVRGAVDEGGVGGAAVRVDVDPAALDGPPPPRELLTTVHRVVAEGLTNVARHAPGASEVAVTAARADDHLVVAVANDGATAAGRGGPGGGFGLVGMSERVRAVGGTLRSGPDGPGRWLVEARIPVRDAVAGAPRP